MSLARVHSVKKCRKDQGDCGSCGVAIKVGDPYLHFSVGFRGMTRRRCTKTECYPKPSERESSLVSSVYAAQESIDVHSASSTEELQAIRDEVVAACEEVVSEYENNEMFERNPDLQERAETITSAGEELSNWEPEPEEPTEDEDTWPEGVFEDFDEAHDFWLSEAQGSLESAINEMELP